MIADSRSVAIAPACHLTSLGVCDVDFQQGQCVHRVAAHEAMTDAARARIVVLLERGFRPALRDSRLVHVAALVAVRREDCSMRVKMTGHERVSFLCRFLVGKE